MTIVLRSVIKIIQLRYLKNGSCQRGIRVFRDAPEKLVQIFQYLVLTGNKITDCSDMSTDVKKSPHTILRKSERIRQNKIRSSPNEGNKYCSKCSINDLRLFIYMSPYIPIMYTTI